MKAGLTLKEGNGGRYSWIRLSIERARPGERRWGWPVSFRSGEQIVTTLTVAGLHFRKIVQADRVGRHVMELEKSIGGSA